MIITIITIITIIINHKRSSENFQHLSSVLVAPRVRRDGARFNAVRFQHTAEARLWHRRRSDYFEK
jgi:hypothetical protein